LLGIAACAPIGTPPPGREQLASAGVALPLLPASLPVEDTAPATLGRGLASWYGRSHQGHRTASGARFNRNALTAAHPYLPLNSCLDVLNPANGKQVEVTVTDRGPWIGHRIVDLSEAAAEAIGMRQQGVAQVVLSSCVRKV
jgi:rare lipoprotein A